EPVALGTCGPIARRHEHVEVKTLDLKRLARTPIAQVGMVARRDGKGVPIPFQVDEREGRTIALLDGAVPTADSRPRVLDPDDLVVFMPCDAGTRIEPPDLAAAVRGLQTWREIEIADPLDATRGWAYVVVADQPPATARRYVAYEPSGDLVSAA